MFRLHHPLSVDVNFLRCEGRGNSEKSDFPIFPGKLPIQPRTAEASQFQEI
jgi:hypothetical protein